MALDTAEKRRAVSFIMNIVPGVTPNASPDVEWRYQSGYSYKLIPTVPTLSDASIASADVGRYIQQRDNSLSVRRD